MTFPAEKTGRNNLKHTQGKISERNFAEERVLEGRAEAEAKAGAPARAQEEKLKSLRGAQAADAKSAGNSHTRQVSP